MTETTYDQSRRSYYQRNREAILKKNRLKYEQKEKKTKSEEGCVEKTNI